MHCSRYAPTSRSTTRLPVLFLCAALPLVSALIRDASAAAVRASDSPGANWPMWRCDAGHTAFTPAPLPEGLHLQWTVRLAPPKPCWPWTQPQLRFDTSYEPVLADGLLFVPSMVRDRITALDLHTGKERWRFYADGPIRLAPVWHDGRLFFTSDDGFLYCLETSTGRLLWRFPGAPRNTYVLGNGRIVASRPARGGPVVYDGTVYFAASVWPFMGVFIHALDARTGKPVWSNTGSGQVYVMQPHGSPAFGGVAPQGVLVATDSMLLVPGGRSVPAGYDRKTGRFLYYRHAESKKYGGYAVSARGPWFINAGYAFDAKSGDALFPLPADVLTPRAAVGVGPDGTVCVWALGESIERQRPYVDRKGRKQIATLRYPVCVQRVRPEIPPRRLFFKAGDRVFAAGPNGVVFCFRLSEPAASAITAARKKSEAALDDWLKRQAEGKGRGLPSGWSAESVAPPTLVPVPWETRVAGEPWTALGGAGRLVIVTTDGRILCFGDALETAPPERSDEAAGKPDAGPDDAARHAAQTILAGSDLTGGCCLVLGASGKSLADALLSASPAIRRLVLLASPPEVVRRVRKTWDAAGIYGVRAVVLPGNLSEPRFAPYLAALVVVPDPREAGIERGAEFAKALVNVLRPYGGSAWLRLRSDERTRFRGILDSAGVAGVDVREHGEWLQLIRRGPLPGAGTWTLQYGDAANSVCSRDRLVRPPFGLLWFGGPSNLDVLPRHGHGPPEQVVGGRLFLEGIGKISARDVYTGTVLWRRELPGLDAFGMYYDRTFVPDPFDRSYNQVHIPGANAWGTNFAATTDRVYVVLRDGCAVLDATTGRTLATFRLPPVAGIEHPRWGYIGVYGDLLIAGAAPVYTGPDRVALNYRYGRGSRGLVVMDRHDGRVLWKRAARYNFRHNTIVAGNGRIFCIDGMTRKRLEALARRGIRPEGKPELLALDARTGRVVWTRDKDVFGTWLGYSEEFDILLEAGSRSGDRAPDETARGMAAFRGATGELLWKNDADYYGPCILHHDRIITQVRYGTRSAAPGQAWSLLTGKPILRKHPMTGREIPWTWLRFYGCNTAIGGEYLLTFRSATGAYVDLKSDAGTATLGGFKSGCTSNLVPADGVLNAPDYTRTCTCKYPNQSSLALVHADDVEAWTFTYLLPPSEPVPVKRAGLNLGAPGDFTDADGILWLDVPSTGGPSPDLPVWFKPDRPRWFRRHVLYQDGKMPQVAASGAEDIRELTVRPFVQPSSENSLHSRVDGWKRNAFTLDPICTREEAKGRFEKPQLYTVRLIFSEPEEDVAPGERVFDIALQGKIMAEKFDVRAAAGASRRTVVREFRDVPVLQNLVVTFIPAPASKRPPILCGIELQMQE